MRIRRLELAGIGPFAATYTIDFDALTAGGLFLLDGPTGSGKSTIIDAITWGLYGAVAGGRDSTDDRMRSTHAAPAAQSYVDLVFSVEAGTFRVRRTPQWTKPGNKNPTNATGKLWRLSEGAVESGRLEAGEVLETKAAGTSIEVARLIGLNREQFVQTIVLPQGKFADFLRLRSSERTALLEQIFDTGIYRRVAEELSRRANEGASEVASARQAWLMSAAACVTALDLESERAGELSRAADGAATPEEAQAVAAELDRLLARCRADAARAEAARDSARSTAAKAARRAQEAADLNERLARRSSLLGRQALLAGRSEEIGRLREELALHEAAGPLLPYLDACEKAERRVDCARTRLADLGEEPSSVDAASLAATAGRVDDLAALCGRLDELLHVEEGVAVQQEEQRERRTRLEALDRAIAAAEEAQAELPARRMELERRLADAHTLASTVEARRLELTHRQGLRDQAAERTRLRAVRETAREKAAEAAAAFQSARQARERTASAWLASTAAILASQLAEAEPCPVCGSRDHPSPAPAAGIRATKGEVDAADLAASRARDALDAAQRDLASVEARLEEVSRDLGGLSEEDAVERLEQATAALTEAERAHEAAASLTGELSDLDDRIEEEGERRRRDIQARASLETEIRTASLAIDASRERIAPELAGHASIADRRGSLAAALAQARKRLEAGRELLVAQSGLAERDGERAAALEASRFTAAEDVRAALMAPEDAHRARSAVESHERELRDVARDLAAPGIADLTGEEEPHADELAAAAGEAESAAAAADRQATLLADRVERSRTALDAARARAQTWQEARRAAGPALRLANLANAGSESVTRIPLATFVVQQRFEQIVDRANERLADISLGRYRLERTDERERGSREAKTGLGLLVVDRDGEASGSARRSTRSLSGGETFYVSLSLALALADVVRAENGGIAIDTLLIDEGFGSLDDDTLSLVMSTLTGLARNGRSVGLVSHVSEMKKLIAEQINVRPLPGGSSRLDVRC